MQMNEDNVRLHHMLDAAERVLEHTRGKTREDLERDDLLSLAIVRLLEMIGEAARAVSPEMRSCYPSVPWKEIAGTRDRLIHGYFNVDLDIVWAIVSDDLPMLVSKLRLILY